MAEELIEIKKEKFSYSKLDVFESCHFKYKLQYIDKHYINDTSIALEFGTLIHFIEETIANDIIANNNEPDFLIDTDKYIDLFINAEIIEEKKTILGIKKLKEKYPKDFYEKDKRGLDYADKANHYLNNGIFYLRDFLRNNRHIKVIATEKNFQLEYKDVIFSGSIDRVYYDELNKKYLIEDIKTWTEIGNHKLTTPLQFVVYCLAAQKIYNITDIEKEVQCDYYLPLAMQTYNAGTKGFINRGKTKLDALFNELSLTEFEPSPSPLCHWCQYCNHNPNQKEEAKNLCPYFSHWTPEKKDFSVEYEWQGLQNHAAILESFINKNMLPEPFTAKPIISVDLVETPDYTSTQYALINSENRIKLIRR